LYLIVGIPGDPGKESEIVTPSRNYPLKAETQKPLQIYLDKKYHLVV
jgi:hypothetical protein